MKNKSLQRSLVNRKIAGVAGGLAEHFEIDPVIIRILFVLAFFFGGGGLLIYIILWIVLPENRVYPNYTYQNPNPEGYSQPTHAEPYAQTEPQQSASEPYVPSESESKANRIKNGNFILGSILIIIGLLFLVNQFILYISIFDFWPVIFIILGIGMIVNSLYKKK